MNRLQDQPLGTLDTELPTNPWCEAGKITADETHTRTLVGPLHYEPNYAYPLIVWLHGSGNSERQLRRVMPLVSLRNYVSVAPRGTMAMSLTNIGASGYRWVQSPEQIGRAEQRVWEAITAAKESYNIRTDRIFIAGYECGGTMALRIAVEHADRFAGALSLGGPFPDQGSPLAKLHKARRQSLFIAACREGRYYPTDKVCDNLRLLHTAGMSLTLREYPGGDGLSPLMLADVDRWIMEQIAQTSQTVSQVDGQQSGVN
jgi:phospholipase/carboxylesterase